jgi:peptide/nickel transport system substrate-binding protein
MRSSLRSRAARVVAAAALALATVLPAAAPVTAADPVVLRVGTTQDIDSLNPYATLLVVGYEAFQLTYNLLVDFGPNLDPVPGFADSWERAADGHSWVFHIRDNMKWSDGQPATSEDACFSWQLAIDSIAANGPGYLGSGYIDPGVSDAGVTAVSCPDPLTMIATTDDASDRILQTYMPIIPKHIWGSQTYDTIGDAAFDAPLVGTGPYTAVEWQTGQFVRFQRNPNYWGTPGFADEVDIVIYSSADTMVQALKTGELDYAHSVNPDQLNALKTEPNIQTVVGKANGWTQLAFNTYGTGTGNTIPDGGPSTQALLDPAFRDALGYAIDKQTLVDRVLGGYGDVGTTIIPPVISQWHVEPTNPRTFSIDLAKQKLEAAGYPLDTSGNRLDKQGKAITLRMYMPDSDAVYPKAAQFVVDWYGQLGIKVTTQVLDSGTLGDLVLPPEANYDNNKYTADYDIELWGWSWNVDPSANLQIFKCDAIGSSSDSQYCDPAFDKLYDDQLAATTAEQRHPILAEMQNKIYDAAPYDILFYDSNLDAYRTDRFAGWWIQPTGVGTPMFTYGTLGYTLLTDATAVPSPTPAASAESAAPSAAPTPAPSGGGGTSSGDSTALIVAVAVVVVVGGAALYFLRGRNRGSGAEEG